MSIFSKKEVVLEAKNYSQGDFLFREGEMGSEAYRIIEGRVEILIGNKNQRAVLAQFGPGSIIGEMSLLGDAHRSASAKCLTGVIVEVITESDFGKILTRGDDSLTNYLGAIFSSVRAMNSRLRVAEGIPKYKDEGVQNEINSEQTEDDSASDANTVSDEPELESIPDAVRLLPNSEFVNNQSSLKERVIKNFPFYLGRRRESAAIDYFQNNEIVIFDTRPYSISREHCVLEKIDDNYFVRDLGSYAGTIVNGIRINGQGTGETKVQLSEGVNELILGSPESKIRFKLVV